jgi:RimJ/RimL family protein N-acetyltransferase
MFLAPTRYQCGDLTLRAYQAGDGAAVSAATVDSYEHLKPWMQWASTTQTAEEGEAIVRRLGAAFLSGTDFTLGIWLSDEYVGGTGFHMRCGPIEWQAAEIGMWIRASHAGKGLGSRVLAAMLEWGFGEWDWERLIWKCDTLNVASARVAARNGMTLEATHRSDAIGVDGARRDTHLYVMLKSDYVTLKR